METGQLSWCSRRLRRWATGVVIVAMGGGALIACEGTDLEVLTAADPTAAADPPSVAAPTNPTNPADDGVAGAASSDGFPVDGRFETLRIVIASNVAGGLGPEIRRVVFNTSAGDVPAFDGSTPVGAATSAESQRAAYAFDGDETTWWGARTSELPVWVEATFVDGPVPPPRSVWFHLKQSETRAPTRFRVLGYDGARWWELLSAEVLPWAEAADEVQWQRDQRSFPLRAPEDYVVTTP